MTRDIGRILVPLDGSQLAEAVIPFAIGIAQRTNGSLTLLHVLEQHAPDSVHGQPHLKAAADATAYLDHIARRCRKEVEQVDTHVHTEATSDVAADVAEHAKELDIGLIAIATHGSGGMRGLLIGDIAQQILHRSRTSLLLVRPDPAGGAQPFQCGELLVAVEPVRHSDVALPVAASLARSCEAVLHLVTVVPPPEGLPVRRRAAAVFSPASTRAVLQFEREDAEAYLEEKRAQLEAEGIRSKVEVRTGEPTEEIAGILQRKGADLLVVATHGQAGLGAMFSGSFASRIMQRARYPVLLVRA